MASISTGGTLEGTLSKWTNVMKGWQYRFFVLDENAGLLSYYTSKEKMMKGVRRGCVRLKDAVIGIDDQEDNTFTITVDHKTFHFQAQHSEEREKWVRRLEDTIRRHANRSRLWDNSNSTFYLGGYGKDANGKRTNHLELLARRVSEADAYLQLMIEQTNKIDQRIEAITDEEERAKCKVLQDNASTMLDHIKHSIVSLQIAKNMAHPINGIYNGPTGVSNASPVTNTSAVGTPTSAIFAASNVTTQGMATTPFGSFPMAVSSTAATTPSMHGGVGGDDDDSTTDNANNNNSNNNIIINNNNDNDNNNSSNNFIGNNNNNGNNSRRNRQLDLAYGAPPAATFSVDIVDEIADGIEFGTACLPQQPAVVGFGGGGAATACTIDTYSQQLQYDHQSMQHMQQQQQQHFPRNLLSVSLAAGVTTAPLAVVVPETSYSSSEGEEDFYDANDDLYTSMGSSPVCATRGFSVETSPTHEHAANDVSCSNDVQQTAAAVAATINSPFGSGQQQQQQYGAASSIPTSTVAVATTPATISEIDEYQTASSTFASLSSSVNADGVNNGGGAQTAYSNDGTIDYDALYEEEEDTSISMEAHGSMISHLLSQVKIGMDLTKVVLPTFILERRSLLEMYADYFAHPDLFLKIAELDSPRDRIVQVTRWYLSAYHAGRKSAVAKKPYNPVLGEIFQCHWDIPDEIHDDEVVSDGPIPWCRRNQLTFLAEQVSHHPPISAFYAEHYNRKITFSAHVWTKSKFLGLSIGVHNIGEGTVTLVDRSEEYIVTFPNGYGRSILTVPWIELGGSVEIRCPQTGYYANVEFLTKPFYGGKRNKVTAEIYEPNEKKPFVSIAGEWSGLMEAKWHDRNKTEVFVDVNRIPIFKKQVRPIVEQEAYESRRVWKEVTAGLKFNDIEKATNAKCSVEQLQRDQAKQRKETDEQWEQKYFTPVGENWIYTRPLSQRIYMQEKQMGKR